MNCAFTLDVARQLDAGDPLACFRTRFHVGDSDTVYLDGNSLGPPPRRLPEVMDGLVRERWGRELVQAWGEWIDWSARLGDRLATHVLGAGPGEVILSDSTSVNLYKLAAAALDSNPERHVVVVDSADFPTNRYVVQGLASQRNLRIRTMPSHIDDGLDLATLHEALDTDVALVVLSLVAYRSGARLDMKQATRLADDVGAPVVWDLSHAAGAVPVHLRSDGAKLAVGCTYKYLSGGPGAPAYLYVSREMQSLLRQPIWGWFGQRDQFGMGPDYDPCPSINRFLVSTPPVLSMAAIGPALDIIEEAGIDRIHDKGEHLCELVIAYAEDHLTGYGVTVASPRRADARGLHVCLAHPDAWRLCQALRDRGVVTDFRQPNRLRLGIAPLVCSYQAVRRAMTQLHEILERRSYESYRAEIGRIT